MEHPYSTLQTLAEAVRELPNPSAYYCTPRELILRCPYDWAQIYGDLAQLEEEKLVALEQTEPIRFAITAEGLVKANALQETVNQKSRSI